MIYFTIGCCIYLSIGLGFALSSWLQAQEINVKNKQPVTIGFWKCWIHFTLAWWVLAIYCYRVEVSRTVMPVEIYEEVIKEKK